MRAIAVLLLLAGCNRTPTLDDLARGRGTPGQSITLRGRVKDVTWLTRASAERILLLAAEDESGLGESQREWGVGARLPGERLRSREWRLAQRGDLIEVTGTLGTLEQGGATRPVIEALTAYAVVEATGPALADVGASCARDLDCQDDLVCTRQGACAALPELTWNSDARNIHGTCVADEDCPIAQRCDPGYTVTGTGDYRPPYHASRDVGRKLCQVDVAAMASDLCPRTIETNDYLGGRYPEGKEVCVRGFVEFAVFNPGDRDTHVQARLRSPAIFPQSEPSIETFGATLETVPPRKDPSNPRTQPDPANGQTFEALGTVHYDDSHNWWEIHPIKWWRAR